MKNPNTEMNRDTPDQKSQDRLQRLRKKRREIMALPPAAALDRILEDSQPAALVHSLPMNDFYLLVHDIGPEDSLPLLELASDRQWDHLVDLETWQHERLDIIGASRWLDLLLTADPDRFVRWTIEKQLDLIELYLWRNLEVRIREHDQDPSDFGSDFFSIDSHYYVRIIDLPVPEGETVFNEAHRQGFINKFLNRLADFHHPTYQSMLLETAHIIPAETEETALHWRNVRLAEKGFLPFDEAVGIYQPLKPGQLPTRAVEGDAPVETTPGGPPVPVYPFKELASDSHFARALQQIDTGNLLNRIQYEFAHLCNRIIVADRLTVKDRESLREVVQKACAYISIGLEQLAPAPARVDPAQAANRLNRHALVDLFRVGFGRALALKWSAENWLNDCWFAASGLRLTFWGEKWMGILGGLLIKKPLFYDNYRSGKLYREFGSTKEIEDTEFVFSQIKKMDELLSLMTIHLRHPSSYGFLTYKNLLLTMWAASHLGWTPEMVAPMEIDAFRSFFSRLFPADGREGVGKEGCIPEPMKQSFLDWLSAETGLKAFEINAQLGASFSELFEEIEGELGAVAADKIDPRFVNLFLLKQPQYEGGGI
jgi:hypothetical protein